MESEWSWGQGKPPPNRRVFGERYEAVCDELTYVCDKLSYWLYARQSPRRARRYRTRLARLVSRSRKNPVMLVRIQSQAVLADLDGHRRRAAGHLERKLRIMHVDIGEYDHPGTPHAIRTLRKYGEYDWRVYGRLAEIYREFGQIDRAVAVLQRSKAFCREHRFRFEAQNLLNQLLREQSRGARRTQSPVAL